MSPVHPSCSRFEELLADLVDGTARNADLAFADEHRRRCPRCARLEFDLINIRKSAGDLPVVSPSRDLWPNIASRIKTPVVEIAPRPAAAATHKRRWMLGTAAAALVVVTAGLTYTVARLQRTATVEGGSAAVELARPYDRQIGALQAVLAVRRDNLDSGTAAVIERNMRVLDNAIDATGSALARYPSSDFLLEQYRNALSAKVGLLRTAVTVSMVSYSK